MHDSFFLGRLKIQDRTQRTTCRSKTRGVFRIHKSWDTKVPIFHALLGPLLSTAGYNIFVFIQKWDNIRKPLLPLPQMHPPKTIVIISKHSDVKYPVGGLIYIVHPCNFIRHYHVLHLRRSRFAYEFTVDVNSY